MSASTTPVPNIVSQLAYKGRDGWEAKTTVDMGMKDESDKPMLLVVHTHKTQGGVVSAFTVFKDEGDGGMSCVLFGDYSKRLITKGARCTEKTVREMHKLAEDSMATHHLPAAIAFYAPKETKPFFSPAAVDELAALAAQNKDVELTGFADPMHY